MSGENEVREQEIGEPVEAAEESTTTINEEPSADQQGDVVSEPASGENLG